MELGSPQELATRWVPFAHVSAYARALGLSAVDVSPAWCVARLAYDERWVLDASTGVMHGAVITGMLDTLFGFSINVKLGRLQPMVTVDLRVDHLKPPAPGRDLLGGAVCYSMTDEFAFVRGAAYHDSPDDPVATGVGLFMFTDKAAGKPR
jgi:uncharacterized protein (TIGR00369 family)